MTPQASSLAAMLEPSWRDALAGFIASPPFSSLAAFVDAAYSSATVYPPREKLFEAFRRTPFDKVKAVIIGQDPYHEPGQAQGLAFCVPTSCPPPPSLRNIAKELGHAPDFFSWADDGVLLMNSILTVERGKALSHKGCGWEAFSDAAVEALSTRREGLVFILWGAHAQKKGAAIDRSRHCVIESAHPSPLSARRGFFGSAPFRRANDYLVSRGEEPIDW